MRSDGSAVSPLASGWCCMHPSISPDGTFVVFADEVPVGSGEVDLYVATVGTAEVRRLTSIRASSGIFSSSVSPDGRRVAFSVLADNEMFVVNIDGTGLTPLGAGTQPNWSPDGSKLAFVLDDAIVVSDADGKNRVALTEGDGNLDPTWSPDGSRIAFISYRDGVVNEKSHKAPEIYVMNADGSFETRITNDTLVVSRISWSN